MTTLSFLLLELSPFVLFLRLILCPLLVFELISCPLCNTNTLLNILMILCRNVEQDEMTSCAQEWQLWLSSVFEFRFCVHSVTWIPFTIFWWYLVEMKNRPRHVTYKYYNSFIYILYISFFFFFNIIKQNLHQTSPDAYKHGRHCRPYPKNLSDCQRRLVLI